MRIQLYNPPVHHYAGVHYKMNPPLGLPILAGILNEAGHNVSVWDLEALQCAPSQLAAIYESQRHCWPEAVGFTVTTHNKRGARECIQALRGLGYQGYVMLGGPHATLDPQECLSFGADCVVVGECEGNIAAIVDKRLKGIVAGQPLAIEDIPGPAWETHHPQPSRYHGNLPKIGHPEGIAMWSRGCPASCTFCGNPVFGRSKIRFRPADRIREDMASLKGLGVRSVFVYDDELVGASQTQAEWLIGACDAVSDLDLTWKCQGRCSQKLTKDVLEAMYAAGCRAIMWGVESFSERVLKEMKKGTSELDIWHALKLAREAGIGNWLFLMVGNYGETVADLTYTERCIRKARAQDLVQWKQVTVCTPVRGTELYERAKSEGWLVEPPEDGPQMAQIYNATPWLTEREIKYWKGRLEAA